ncbi:endonuclease-reverse transcriptase domain-containing protein [Phthorimaea operculella]|nr:endonuclease-reverse transcriptase domain-containing protein [Phthorimaea operculella]
MPKHLVEALTDEIGLQALCFTETFITEKRLDLLKLQERTDLVNFSVEFILEISAVELEDKNTILIVAYWPEENREFKIFYATLEKILQRLSVSDKNKNIIIGGDFNINVLVNSKLTRTVLNLMRSNNFTQHIAEPTRITSTSSKCIDLLFTNFINSQLVTTVNEYGLSDHKGVLTISKRALDINFSFQNIPLNCVDTSNLLGLEIDTYINWKPHIQKIASKLSRFTYALSELKKTTNQTTATSAYYAYANSWLSYGIILWGNSTDVKDLFKLQKRCIRIITNISQDESCRPHFRQQNILTLTSMYIFETAKFVRKHKYIFPNDKDPPNSRLRPRNKMAIPFSRMKMFCSGPYTMGIKIYNNIPMTDSENSQPASGKEQLSPKNIGLT